MHPRLKHDIERRKVLAQVKRWSIRRKIALMGAILQGYVSFSEACATHRLSAEELENWWTAYHTGGPSALKLTAPRTAPPLSRQVSA